jgi:hypothetical protein
MLTRFTDTLINVELTVYADPTSGAAAGVRGDTVDTRRVVEAWRAGTFVDVDLAVHTSPTGSTSAAVSVQEVNARR